MTGLSRLLREPLLHFFIAGAGIFAVYMAVARPGPSPADVISIGPERLKQLYAAYETVWRRPPTEAEMAGLAEDFVREEIYYREAIALGLDRDDTVIRQRLRQKMEFLSEAGAELEAPTDAELEQWFTANQDAYRREPELALQQVFIGDAADADDVARRLAALRAAPDADFAAMGMRTLLPADLELSRPQAVDGIFGRGFFGVLQALPTDIWSGPVTSSYGLHLVRITDSRPGRTPMLEEIRESVARDWDAHRATTARKSVFARLRSQYRVFVDGAPAPNLARE
ncbi:MAG: peptidylprolyl isomerase [Gammaproteobacteria bacterium]|nr:peptidylprolyl isomerase [Gammaproteobacteria bacterium]